MIVISGSNAVYTSADNQSITLDLVTDTLGTIPCTVHPNDPPTAQIYADCISGKYGVISAYVVPPVTLAQLENEIQKYIDSKAIAKGYDSANSCISYLTSTNPLWASDATSMRNWRDAVWTSAYVNQGSANPATTWTQVQAILPVTPW